MHAREGVLIGLDAGGSGVRCLVRDVVTGEQVTSARPCPHPVANGPAGPGFELDLARVWQGLAETTREALDRARVTPERVLGLAATSMRFALVVVDEEGTPLFAVPNRDARAAAEAHEIQLRHGDEIHARAGHWVTAINALPRLLWLARHDEERWARCHRVLALSDWLHWRLCGEWVAEATQAGESLLFDLKTRDWSWDWMGEPELPQHLLPCVAEPGTLLGGLRDDAARDLGLAPGTPVALGGADTQCGLLGVGLVEPGGLGAVAGTTVPLELVLDRPLLDPERRLWTGHHLPRDRWVLESNAGGMGEALEWLARLLAPGSRLPVARLLAEAERAAPGAGGMLSSFGAELSSGCDLVLPYGSLSLSHLGAPPAAGRADLARAVLEGMAFALRAHRERLDPFLARTPARLHLAGGMTRSPFWPRLLADVLAMRVRVAATPETSALGAALCAGVAAGVHRDFADAARAAEAGARDVEPDPATRARYAELYPDWRRVCEARSQADDLARGISLGRVLAGALAQTAPPRTRVRPRILVTAELDGDGRAALSELGDVEFASFREKMRLLSGPALVKALAGVQVFVTEVDVVDAAALARLPELRVVVACRGDAVNVDVEACSAYGIPVLHAPGRNADAVADLTLAFLLMLARKLPEAIRFLGEPGGEAGDMGRMGQAFGRLQGRELWRKTVGLVGVGAVGRRVAARLAPFGARVLAHDPALSDAACAELDLEGVPLEVLLTESDFVSLHCPLTDATRGLLDAAALARMKPGACLVNTARAALVDETALVDALRRGVLGGAALDVFWVEPPGSDHPLLAMENVIVTPHVGGNTAEVATHQGCLVAEDFARLLAGARPRHVVDPEALVGFDLGAPRQAPDAARLARLGQRSGPAVSDLERETRSPASPRPAPAPAPTAAGQAMERVLRAFVEGIATDAALARFDPGRDVTLHFRLPDVGREFHIRLGAGGTHAALGPPEGAAEVQLRMRADVLDGMFTGRVNAMQAAMEGRLSFTGDAARAMTLQQVQGDLARLYRAAREQAGDPGDLASLPEPGGAPAAPPAAARDLREELVRVVDELYAQQLITATGGNVSVRDPDADQIWITPSQLFKGDLSPDILVRVDLEGHPLDEGARSPSSECLMHCSVYAHRRNVRAVVHAHAPHATILANAGLPFLPISTEAAFFGDIPRVPFLMPGTRELAVAVADALGDGWAVLLQNHGLLVAGRSLRRAADMVEIIERSAEIILGCHALGKPPPTLPDDVVARLRAMGDLVA